MGPDFLVQFLANLFKIVLWLTAVTVVIVAPLPDAVFHFDCAVLAVGLFVQLRPKKGVVA